MSDLVKRLRDQRWNCLGFYTKTAHEAADHIEAQAARIERLEAAHMLISGMIIDHDDKAHSANIRLAVRLSRAALKENQS